MLRFVDLEEAYEAADKALGGWLPGGGTANPLSNTVRPVLDALPTAEADPSLKNYYADRVKANQQRGKRLVAEAAQAVEAASQYMLGQGELSDGRAFRDNMQRAFDLQGEAALSGVGTSAPFSDEESLRAPGESDRQMTKRFERYQEIDEANPEWDVAGTVASSGRDPVLVDRVIELNQDSLQRRTANKAANTAAKTTQSNNWSDKRPEIEGIDTTEGPGDGAISCVYAVNKTLKQAGVDVPWKDPQTGQESVYVPFVVEWITNNGGGVVNAEQAKPGDIVVWPGEGHMGILTNEKNSSGEFLVLSNSSSAGRMAWKKPLENETVYRVPQLQN